MSAYEDIVWIQLAQCKGPVAEFCEHGGELSSS